MPLFIETFLPRRKTKMSLHKSEDPFSHVGELIINNFYKRNAKIIDKMLFLIKQNLPAFLHNTVNY